MISDATLERVLRSRPAVLLTGDLVRACVVAALLVAIAAGVLYNAALARFMVDDLHMNDFGKFYHSAHAFLAGADMYGSSAATAVTIAPDVTREFWNMNPPHFHLLVLPLAGLEPVPALVAWAVLSSVAMLTTLWIVVREMKTSLTLAGVLWAAAGIAICSATGMLVVTGQVTWVLALPVTLAWRAARRGAWRSFGAWMGACASVKPFLGVFLLYALLRRRGALSMIVSGTVCVGAGLAIFGTGPYAAWMRVVNAVDWTWAPMNASIAGGLARNLSASPMFVPWTDAPVLVRVLTIVVAVVFAAGSAWWFARDTSPGAVDRACLGLLLTAMIASPLGWFYYVWLIVGPAALLCRTLGDRPSRLRTACLLIALPGLVLPLPLVGLRHDPIGALTLGSIYGWSALALWLAVVLDARTQPVAAAVAWRASHR
ncbi:MAG: DUF2029 domain-containing protein [Acidobacteria bacterium]|nr:DUF2029 domain-containing protein [Acidobacteriota bacterium]